MNKALRFTFIGAALGGFLAGWAAPPIIGWYFAPPVELAVNCGEAVTWGIQTFREVLLLSMGIGAGIALATVIALHFRKPKKPKSGDQKGTAGSSETTLPV